MCEWFNGITQTKTTIKREKKLNEENNFSVMTPSFIWTCSIMMFCFVFNLAVDAVYVQLFFVVCICFSYIWFAPILIILSLLFVNDGCGVIYCMNYWIWNDRNRIRKTVVIIIWHHRPRMRARTWRNPPKRITKIDSARARLDGWWLTSHIRPNSIEKPLKTKHTHTKSKSLRPSEPCVRAYVLVFIGFFTCFFLLSISFLFSASLRSSA